MTVHPVVNGRSDTYSAEPSRISPLKFSVLEIWDVARLRGKIILGTAAVLFLLVATTIFAITPIYTGTAVVMLDPRQKNVVDVQAVLSGLATDQTTILTQVQILQSASLASHVISKLKLDQDPEFNEELAPSVWRSLAFVNPLHWLASFGPELTPEQKQARVAEAVLAKFEKRLSVDEIGLSSAINVSFDSEDPGKAARVANAIAEAYVEDQLDSKFDATQKATQWLAGRLGQLGTQAAEAESAVEKYKTDYHLTEVVGQMGTGLISVLDQQIAQVNTQLMQAQTDRAQAEATAAHVKVLVQAGQAAEVNQVLSSPLIAQLRGQEAQLVQQIAQLSSRYGPEHPKMLDLQAEKHDLETKISDEITKVVATAENDASVARAHEAVLQSTLARLEAQSGTQGQDRVKLGQLEANASSARSLYDNFVGRSKQTQQEEGLEIPDARVLSAATIPLLPSFPKRTLYLGGGFLAALIFGFLVAFIFEHLDNGFRIASRAEEVLGLPIFATLPNCPGSNPADLVVSRPLSSFAESIRGLEMGISLSNVDKPPKIIVVTSALPSEGKTTSALSLARHMAQTGHRTVIVDADFRRPTIKDLVGTIPYKFDLVDVLRGDCGLENAIYRDPKSQTFVLPILKHVKNAPDLIGSNAMARVIEQLRATFDYVVVDSAPVLPVNDTKVLARRADAVVFAVRWEQTPRNAALDAVKALKEAHAPVAGAVLTRADTRRLHYYSFGYGSYQYGYSKYYQDAA